MNRLTLIVLMFGVSCFVPVAVAEQYQIRDSAGQPKVVHTRLAPVIMHRAFPPYWGMHVYKRSSNARMN